MRSRQNAPADTGYPTASSAQGGAAVAALGNWATQTAVGGLGPATSIALLYPSFSAKVSGVLFITGQMDVVDATPGEDVTFTLAVDGTTIQTAVVTASASGRAFASFANIIIASVGSHSIALDATATHDLTSAGRHQQLNVIELPPQGG